MRLPLTIAALIVTLGRALFAADGTEAALDLIEWKNIPTPNAAETDKKKREEPRAQIVAKDGKLRITFDAGEWPTIGAPPHGEIPWNTYRSFHADVTVDRTS